jgi:Fe-S oxidoreductase
MNSEYEIQIPLDPSNLGGTFSLGKAEVFALKDGRGIARFTTFNEKEINWLKDFDYIYFQTLRGSETLKAIRKATEEDIKKFRVPVWIQGEEEPVCCGKPMFFVGQIDDDAICAEAPVNANMWWHDAASFYVFTCSECLSVEAIGQQF